MKDKRRELVVQAGRLLEVSQSIDYQLVIENDEDEVAKLHRGIESLDIMPYRRRGDIEFASTDSRVARPGLDVGDSPRRDAAQERSEEATRRGEIMDQLNEQGFSERIGKVYDSFAETRSCSLADVPHRRGLPVFEMVIAPDFAPISGMHGVFVSNLEVMSVILPYPGNEHDWEVLNRKAYSSLDEMGEYVTLLSAGFELP